MKESILCANQSIGKMMTGATAAIFILLMGMVAATSSYGEEYRGGSVSRNRLADYHRGTIYTVWRLSDNGIDFEESTGDLCPIPYCTIFMTEEDPGYEPTLQRSRCAVASECAKIISFSVPENY